MNLRILNTIHLLHSYHSIKLLKKGLLTIGLLYLLGILLLYSGASTFEVMCPLISYGAVIVNVELGMM
jgi:hypothetical protein